MTQFRKGLLIGALAISLVIGTIFGVGAVQVSNEPQPEVVTEEQIDFTQAYLYGDYFMAIVGLSESGAKALESQVGDLDTWIGNTVRQRTEAAVDELLVRALQDTTDTYLTKKQKTAFMLEMANRGICWIDHTTIPSDLIDSLILQMKVY